MTQVIGQRSNIYSTKSASNPADAIPEGATKRDSNTIKLLPPHLERKARMFM